MNGDMAPPVHRVFHDLSTFSVDKKKEPLFYGSLKEFPHVMLMTSCEVIKAPIEGLFTTLQKDDFLRSHRWIFYEVADEEGRYERRTD